MNGRLESIRRQLQQYLRQDDEESLRQNLEIVHPSDLAEVLHDLPHEHAEKLLSLLSEENRRDVIEALPSQVAKELLSRLDLETQADVLSQVDPDDAADIFFQFDQTHQENLLPEISNESKRKELIDLMSYPPDSAGGIMTTQYLTVEEDVTAEEAIRAAREASSETETIYYIYTRDESGRLSGALSMRQLLQTDPDRPVREFVQRDLFKVQLDDDQEDAAEIMERYDLLAVPVVDEQDRMRGIITIDDAVDVIEDETTEDFFKKSGMSSIEALQTERSHRVINASIMTNMVVRVPWLLVVGVGGLFAGGVMHAFEEALEATILLAFFVPLLMDMGGNVGTQSTTIYVRGLVLGHVDPGSFFRDLMKELARTGAAIGGFFGVLSFAVAYGWAAWRGEPIILATQVGLTVGISMFLIICLASMIGYIVPWLAYVLNLDPAAASDPVVTTIKDITGLLIYFSVASFLVRDPSALDSHVAYFSSLIQSLGAFS